MKLTWPKKNNLQIKGLNISKLINCSVTIIKKEGGLKIVIKNHQVKPVEIKVNYDDDSNQIYITGQISGQPVVIN